MKKLYAFIAFMFVLNICAEAQYVTIYDTYFGTYLKNKYPGCFNASNQMDTTCPEITHEDSLIVTMSEGTLSGLEYFDSLKYLVARSFWIRSSVGDGRWPQNLKYLDISNNAIVDFASLGALPPGLDTLIIKNQREINSSSAFVFDYPCMTHLGPLPNSLKYLDCSDNQLSQITMLPDSLKWFNCANNAWLKADAGPTWLVYIPVLTSIPALPPTLKYLKCDHNKLNGLPALPASLTYLDCSVNGYNIYYPPVAPDPNPTFYPNTGISNLNFPSSLTYLNCSSNNIASIDLPSLTSLTYLNCSINHIPSIAVFPPTLLYADVRNNQLQCLPHITSTLDTLYAQQNLFNCLPNIVAGVVTDLASVPLCNPVNNSHGCENNPVISGSVFYDNNSNGVQDPEELPKANVRAQLDNGMYAFTNANGYYEFTSDLGTHTVIIDALPVYYNAVPASFSHIISTPDTLITDQVALQPNTFIDSLKITIVNPGTTRPGFNFVYGINYENTGTNIVNAHIVINYDNSKLHFTSSSNAAVIDNGSTLTLDLANLQPCQTGNFSNVFELTPSTVIGDVINGKATISGGTDVCVDSTYSLVVGSFDPNDKQATPSLTEEQVHAGDYINYLIRFQNTGNADAINIVVSDTLSSMLQANTFEMLQASHTCKVTQNNNKLYFEFLNIHLPDMNTDEPASHGFIRFRIKPQTILPDNTTIINRASIYFDFNTPVLTGDATTIVNLTTVPVKLNSFNIKKQNSVVQLYWSTEQEMNSKSFIVERSTDQLVWNEITRLNAAGNSYSIKNYSATDPRPAKGVNYYRLKQVDLDGKFNYSVTRSVYFGDAIVVIAPNPVKDKMMIYLPADTKPVSIGLYNANGQLVKQFSSNEIPVQVNVAGLSKGIYTVSIKGENINEVQKLLIQ